MKASLIKQMRSVLPHMARGIRRSDSQGQDSLPPSFQFVRVQQVKPLGNVFLRVKLQAEDLSAHGDESIHFRIVLPPRNVEPQWPSVAPNGSVRWPEGPGAPHRPVYTARYVDHIANTVVMDVFMHEGGRISDWARQIMDGTDDRNVVGLIGPGGGGLLRDTDVLIAADETGFPPAARLIEGLPQGARATVLLQAEKGSECGYPVPKRDGVSIRWLARSEDQSLVDAVLTELPGLSNTTIWFAGEREDASRLRDAAKAAGRAPHLLRISAFWTSAK